MLDLDSIEVVKFRPKVSEHLKIRELCEVLCIKHDVSVTLKWSKGRRKGVYLKSKKTILIGPNAWNGAESTFLHLFAHAIIDQSCLDSRPHTLRFMECLWKLVIDHYRSPERYRWYGEHSSRIMEFGRNRCRSWRMEKE